MIIDSFIAICYQSLQFWRANERTTVTFSCQRIKLSFYGDISSKELYIFLYLKLNSSKKHLI